MAAMASRSSMEMSRSYAEEPRMSPGFDDADNEQATVAAGFRDPNTPLRVRAAVDGCLALRRESGEAAAEHCYRALRTRCRDCGLPATLAEAAQQRRSERQDAPSDPNAPG